jgi:putative lipoprotein
MKRRSLTVSLAAALAAVMLPGCTTVEPAPATAAAAAARPKVLQGSVLYRDKAALPDDAQVRVQLVDVQAEPQPAVVAETVFASAGKQVPLPFSLPIDPARVKEGRSYAVRAYIAFGGSTRYVTTARVNVDPQALPESVAILVSPGAADKPVADSPPPPGAVRAPSRSTLPRGSGRPQGK